MSECCQRGRDFMSGVDITECDRHGYRGSLPCPWTECLDVPEWRYVEPLEPLPRPGDDPLGADELVHVRERVWARKSLAIPQPDGYARVRFWEEKK